MDKYADMSIGDFNKAFGNENYEVFTQEQVRAFCEDVLKSIDPLEREHGAIDFVSLNRVTVVNEDLSKSVLFWRESQVEWKEESDPVTLMKSKNGYYKDTPENRKKGVVGKPYGDRKAEDFNEAAGNLAKLKMEYSDAVKRGDKAKIAEIHKKMSALDKKEGSGKDKAVE